MGRRYLSNGDLITRVVTVEEGKRITVCQEEQGPGGQYRSSYRTMVMSEEEFGLLEARELRFVSSV